MAKIFQVDAFTDEPFKGNPAGVCILEGPADEGWMQNVAMEMNLSETAFLYKKEGTQSEFNLRWFTPVKEIPLCGHATMASAHILWDVRIVNDYGKILFHTLSGEIRVWREGEFIWMDFLADIPKPVKTPAGLLDALGISAGLSGRIEVFKGEADYLIELENAQEVISLSPDFAALKKIEARGFIVTAKGEGEGEGDSGIDFVSRFFAPALDIDEDPVTGSAHATLAPFWMEKLGKVEFTANQLSKRGGLITIRMVAASDVKDEMRVHLGGKAVTIFSGEFF